MRMSHIQLLSPIPSQSQSHTSQLTLKVLGKVHKQIRQIRALALRRRHRAAVTRRQTRRIDVRRQRLLVLAVEDNPLAQLLADERLEHRKQHIEHVRIVHNVHGFQAQHQHILHPFQQHGSKRRRELHHVVERQAVKVENDHAAADLRGRFAHRAGNADLNGFEQVVERHGGGFPVFYTTQAKIELRNRGGGEW